MKDVMEYKWGSKYVTGEEITPKPGFVTFKECDKAILMLHKHIASNSTIAIHCDVDVDGIGSGYIMGRFLSTQTSSRPLYIINNDKVHGIQQKHADFFLNKPIDLMIIVDSSSNELDVIKQFNCDVLVIDHHMIEHDDTYGKTNDGEHEYIIINNVIDNLDDFNIKSIKCWFSKINSSVSEKLGAYKADDRMSCGLVVYELLRIYCETFMLGPVLENLRLYQWAGVTLLTDSIILNTDRNQWYMDNTVHSMEIEGTLKELLTGLSDFKVTLDKSVISYTIAPVINKAIRAGKSKEALKTVIYCPKTIGELLKYREDQDKALVIGSTNIHIESSHILRDLTDTDISRNYCGVIASKLSGEYNKNAFVYKVQEGMAEGSFRGRVNGVDYRKFVDEFDDTTWAQGHKAAFGFKCPVEKLNSMAIQLSNIENNISDKPLLTAGKLNLDNPGQFVIEDFDSFRKQQGLLKLGIGNSKVSTDEQILITISTSDVVLEEQRGKLYIYDAFGLKCKAFEPINTPTVNLYVEFSKGLECYIK